MSNHYKRRAIMQPVPYRLVVVVTSVLALTLAACAQVPVTPPAPAPIAGSAPAPAPPHPVAAGAALRARGKNLIERLRSLHDTQGVKLELCGITREQVRLDPEKLIAGVELVTSGVVRIAELQHRGFAYIKIE